MAIKKGNPQKKHSQGSSGSSETDKTSKKQGHSGRRAEATIPTQHPACGFPIVGIGASAGGLAAIKAFFSGMPTDTDTGMAFVLVQHQAPDHKSILTGILQRYTRMQVFEVQDGMTVHANCAYIIPPGRDLAVLNGTLQLLEPTTPRGERLPIDFFFRSLAQDQHERAICIILSGIGSDGTLGLQSIKSEGGMVMVQVPESAEFDGMPQSAIGTGLIDYKLLPGEMPAQLIAYVAGAFGRSPRPVMVTTPRAEIALRKIFITLRSQTGHDFSQYPPELIQRQITRRMAVHQMKTLEMYIKFLQQTPVEAESLFRDLLISSNHFFSDSEALKALEKQVIARIFADRPAGTAIRIWSTGCSTGEKAYSLAILLKERMETLKKNYKVQIFATDIDSRAIATARVGLYPAGIAADISTERLARFFTAESGGGNYRIHKGIRDMLVFSEHNIIKDPPFSKLDLITCRNLLIDMGGDLHKKLLPLFHYTLNPGGFLFLGTSETEVDFGELFTTLDRKANLYQRKEVLHGTQRTALDRLLPPLVLVDALHPWNSGKKAGTGKLSLRELTEQTLLQQVAPTGALVTRNGDILYLHGRTGMYLEPPPGVTGVNNILRMAREGLQRDLTKSLRQAVVEKKIVRCQGLSVETNGDFTQVNLTVRPVFTGPGATAEAPLYLVILEEVTPLEAANGGCQSISDEVNCLRSTVHIASLRRELQAKAEYLQATNEELETTNEEMQAVNEELQSTNEELETSKEETQSINEELSTVNAELQTKVSDLSRANNDINNLLAGTGIATVFVDHQLRILRFTPAATGIINLIMGDIGRPMAHIVSKLVGYANLPEDTRTVLDTLEPKEIEAETTEGKWYTLRIHPYRTVNNVIEGAVITFVDITEKKKTQEALLQANELLRLAVVVRDAHDAVTVQDLDGRILAWNPGAARMYGWSETEALTMNVRNLIPEELREQALVRIQQLSLAEILKPFCTQRIAKDGTIMDVSMVSTALIDEADHIYAITTTERIKGHNIGRKRKVLR